MRHLKRLAVAVAVLAGLTLCLPTVWVEAATGRLADLRATTDSANRLYVAFSSTVEQYFADINTNMGITASVLAQLQQSPDTNAEIDLAATAGTYEIVPAAAGEVIDGKVTLFAAGTVVVNFIYGTKTTTDCDTGPVSMAEFSMNTTAVPVVVANLHIPAGKAMCIVTSAAVAADGTFEYSQYVPN